MNQVAVFNPSAMRPSFATKGELSAVTKALAGGGNQGKRISIKGGVFRLMADGKEVVAIDERFLDVVVINAAAKVARTFYAGAYDEANVAPPNCWSADGEKPDASVKDKPAPTCASCPNNQKGSGQGDSRACRFNQRMAVVLANDIEGDVMQLTIPATSIFGKGEGENRPLQEYARFHAAQGNDISMMVTRMRFDTAAATPKLFFKAMRWLEADEYTTTSEKGSSMEAIQAITMTVSQQDKVPAASAPAPLPAPKAKAKPVPAPADDEEPPAPAPKAKAKPAPADDDEAPAPTPKAKAKPAPLPDDEEPPAPAPKAKAAPKEYAQGGEDEGEPVKRPSAAAAKPSPAAGLAAVLGEWDDE